MRMMDSARSGARAPQHEGIYAKAAADREAFGGGYEIIVIFRNQCKTVIPNFPFNEMEN
jgi:hypothetical protein